jgi:hypothetical protein
MYCLSLSNADERDDERYSGKKQQWLLNLLIIIGPQNLFCGPKTTQKKRVILLVCFLSLCFNVN